MSDIPHAMADAVGRIVRAEDTVTAAPVAGLMAAFGHDDPAPAGGDPLPPLWHGLFCTAKLPPSRLGPDGLAKDEPLLPSVPELPDKLFGGARYRFLHPLRIGERIVKESEVVSFERKEGRSGAFVVGLVQHRVANEAGVAVIEENDIVFRPPAPARGASGSAGGGPAEPPGTPVWSRTIVPDPVLMFRHSAVTFNSHRIHYDRDFVRARGYPGLLVQGTLIARLMMETVAAERPGFDATEFSFRAGRPIYDDGAFTISGEPLGDGSVRLWATDHAGRIGMTAQATPR